LFLNRLSRLDHVEAILIQFNFKPELTKKSRRYFFFVNLIHYQKTDKYKRKYRGNIFVGKFPRDFTDGHIPSVYTEGITEGKKIKTKQKKIMTCQDLPTELPTEFIPSVKSVGKSVGKLVYTVHHVNYKGNHRRILSVCIFQRAPELLTFQLHC
jgi:hypothetical protein